MSWRDWLKSSSPANPPDAAPVASPWATEAPTPDRQAEIMQGLRQDEVPPFIQTRLANARGGWLPWIATLTPAELRLARSHGLTPIAAVSATCWLSYGHSWTEGHAQGWQTALHRLRSEARAAGANAVVDVKMRTIPLTEGASMDFTLVGTAVRLEGLPPSEHPVIATVPALEFVRLLQADVVPVGIAVGAHYQWMTDWRGATNQRWMGNTESQALSELWSQVRRLAQSDLRRNTAAQGNGALAHVNFSQMFEREGGDKQPKQYLARHIVVATVIDQRVWRAPYLPMPLEVSMVVDMNDAGRRLDRPKTVHHQSYAAANEREGAV